MKMNEQLTGDELEKVASGNGGADEARADTLLRCTACGFTKWASEIPDNKVCPGCGARNTLEPYNK